jgi:hypothetical protein
MIKGKYCTIRIKIAALAGWAFMKGWIMNLLLLLLLMKDRDETECISNLKALFCVDC